ncbi:GNAT family N-acetyltransferase [Parapedobacter sp. DT-150]|uniref:GNAT family N-acetyltransferase n=1 Tax=Parapedobacter sp. DT-150 TaxID=3396162 RepID=UPI003F1C4DD3
MNNSITIRKERNEDGKAVRDVTRLAFGQDEEAKLVDRLRKNKQAFVPKLSLVAAIGPEIVGHICFTKIRIVNNGNKAFTSLALAPVSVAPDFQNRGIGGMLIKHGLEVARKLGYTSVIVLGHEHYYPRFGFSPAKKWGIKAPFDVPENVFMAIELVEGGLAGISGTVSYPEEFGSV